MIELEFLDIGGEFIPKIHGMTLFDPVYVVSLADIALMKALAYQNREEQTDFEDMEFALGLMVRTRQTFQEYKFTKSEIEAIGQVAETKGDDEVKGLFAQATGDEVK
jgi:hypothetical protein